jgi:hypothetical protein
MGWALVAAGCILLVLAVRIAPAGRRGMTQGIAMLVVAIGGLLLLRRPGSGLNLPGHGPRRWHQP